MIYFGEEEGHLRTFVKKGEIEYQIDIHLKKNKTKGIAINGVPDPEGQRALRHRKFCLFLSGGLKYHQAGPGRTAAVPGYGVMSTG